VDWPVSVALAQSVPALPTGTDRSYVMKLDGHRMIMWRTGDGVRLQARSGRHVTAAWGDLTLACHHLPAGTVTPRSTLRASRGCGVPWTEA
jgi:ATP-dependent DNA ligase